MKVVCVQEVYDHKQKKGNKEEKTTDSTPVSDKSRALYFGLVTTDIT